MWIFSPRFENNLCVSTRLECSFRCVSCLVVVPSRDLAIQVGQVFKAFSHVKTNVLVGGGSVAGAGGVLWKDNLHCDVLVGTAGRLSDLVKGHIDTVKWLVLDEVDRLVPTSGSYDHASSLVVSELLGKVPNTCQKIVLSATMTHDPRALHSLNLRRPFYYLSSDRDLALPQGLVQQYVVVGEGRSKLAVLVGYLKGLVSVDGEQGAKVMVFCNSLEETHGVALALSKYFSTLETSGEDAAPKVVELSSSLSQLHREKVLDLFRRESAHMFVMVCSNVMSRGMDLTGVGHVVNYDKPMYLEPYVHRYVLVLHSKRV